MKMAIVEAQDLRITYRKGKVVAVKGLSFSIKERELFIFIGPDGAGKSSTLKAVCGVLTYDGGKLRTFGVDPNDEKAFDKVRSKLSFMPQGLGHNLYKRLSVEENLELFAALYGVPDQEFKANKELLLRITGLAPFRSRAAGKLSGGMMQKLGLCCALIHRPELLVLDEPTTGVDPVSRREIWKLLYRFQQKGTTALVSTSYLDEAERGTELLLLNGGRSLTCGPPERVIKTELPTFEVFGSEVEEAYRLSWKFSKTPRLKGDYLRLTASPEELEKYFKGLRVKWRRVEPNLEDFFLEKVGLRKVEVPESFKPKVEVPEDAVVVDSVVKRFGDFTAVDGVSFTVKRGEIFGLLGPNGAGKTTLIKTILGLYKATSGRVVVAGEEDPAKIKRLMGYTSQKFSLYSDLTVLENLIYWGSAYGLSPKEVKETAEGAAPYFGLEPYLGELVENLPLGIRQRVALLSALLHSPAILFLDEPTSGVDPAERDGFWQVTRILSKRYGVSVLITTHYMDEAEYCDRILLMNRGKAVALGSPRSLKEEIEKELGTPYLLYSPNPFEAEERLKALGYRATLYGRRVKFFSREPVTPERLKELGLAVEKVKRSSVTMEDVFVFKVER